MQIMKKCRLMRVACLAGALANLTVAGCKGGGGEGGADSGTPAATTNSSSGTNADATTYSAETNVLTSAGTVETNSLTAISTNAIPGS